MKGDLPLIRGSEGRKEAQLTKWNYLNSDSQGARRYLDANRRHSDCAWPLTKLAWPRCILAQRRRFPTPAACPCACPPCGHTFIFILIRVILGMPQAYIYAYFSHRSCCQWSRFRLVVQYSPIHAVCLFLKCEFNLRSPTTQCNCTAHCAFVRSRYLRI